jgi:AraC-like DNA-binding protein/catechol 2,3-dioxygenase-like lactoylglutathione lyase family enzyme
MVGDDVTRRHHREAARRALRYVREFERGRLTLADLASAAGRSPFHFLRVFQRQVGKRPMEHVRDVRLLRAAIALRTTNRSILKIALDAEYETHEGFTRAFRKRFGSTPRDYRKRYRRAEEISAMHDLEPTINLVKIPVSDFSAATAFYREVLGLEEEFAVEAYGWAQYRVGGLPLCLYQVGMGGGSGEPGGDTGIHIAVNDAEAAYRLLGERGAGFACELVASDDGGRFFEVRDPDGNTLKICQAAPATE